MAVGAQALPVDEGVGHRADDFVARETEHLRHHGRRRNFDEHHVIESDAIEAVFERDDPLDLVGLDHRRQHIAHRARRFAAGDGGTREPIRGGQNGAQVVGGVAPLRGEPSIVEVEPANQGADVERRLLPDRAETGCRGRERRWASTSRGRWDRAAWCMRGTRGPRARSRAYP